MPAVPAPFGSDGTLDRAAQDAYADWMARQDIAGVAVWAHTGRGLHLGEETAAYVLSSWRRALPAGKVLVAGVGARPQVLPGRLGVRRTPPADPAGLTDFVVDSTLDMARSAKALGADVLLAFPPTLLKHLDDAEQRIVQVHAALGEVGLPVIAFCLHEGAGGCRYDPRVLDRVLALPHVAGVKVATLDSVMTFQDVAGRMPEGKLLISGEDRFLGYSLMMGARCALVGLGAAMTAMQAALLRAHAAGDFARFHALSAACDRFAAVTFREPIEGCIRRMLWVLALSGVISQDATHDPWGPDVPPDQLGPIERVIGELSSVA